MIFLQNLLDKTGLSFIFKAPADDEKERLQALELIEYFVAGIVKHVDRDIETEKFGFYPHPENQQALNDKADSLGYLQYIVTNKDGSRLELSQFNLVSCNSIKMTDSYRALRSHIINAGYTIELKEINIDRGGIEIFKEPNEFSNEDKRYFVIYVYGW